MWLAAEIVVCETVGARRTRQSSPDGYDHYDVFEWRDQIMPNSNDFPAWDATNPTDSLQRAYQWAVDKANERIEWYQRKSKWKRRWSWFLRLGAVALAAVGVLCPLIAATGLWPNGESGTNALSLGQLGYVFFALAAALHGFDRCFRLSKSWMRFIVTQLSLERLVIEFHYDWASLLAGQQGQPTSAQPDLPAMVQRIKDFSMAVEAAIKQETDAWVAEFQSSLAELEKMLKTEVQTRGPGSLKVTIPNAADFDRVTVQLDSGQARELAGTTEGLIAAVPPGRYEVATLGVKDGQEYRASKIVEIRASAMATVEITLPAPPASPAP